MNDAVTNKIRLLKNIKPNPDWLKSQRRNLLLEISQSGKQAKSAWSLPGFLLPNFVFKPVVVTLMLFCLIFGGSFLTVLAAKNSLPGDLFYPVKIAIENAQVKVSSQERKPGLQAEFVKIRIEEINKIIEETKDPIEKTEKVVKTVDKLQAQIVSTKANLDKIKDIEPEKVVGVVEAVSEKTVQAEEALRETRGNLIEEESVGFADAIDEAIKETSIWAAELKESKSGIEVQMEVKEIKPEVETFEEINK